MKLKRCPFCGSEQIVTFTYPFQKPGLKGCYAMCFDCGASTGKYETTDQAKEAWNRRDFEGV